MQQTILSLKKIIADKLTLNQKKFTVEVIGTFIVVVLASRFWTDPNGNPMTTVVEGLKADWIMEAPSYYGGLPADLANYATAIITVASASPTDTSAAWIHYQSGASLQLTMMNGGNKLSTVEPIDFRSMRFTWHAFY